jgi:DNA processing protein
VAFELGAELTAAGVSVVSGLALGVDASAHRGALTVEGAEPIGVVGSGLDIVYPRANRDLWDAIAAKGTLFSEAPPGSAPERWRFPARNRIIAGLADAVVVVESHDRGGSLHTVDEAQTRAIPVGAVPGPVTASASAGTNALIADGAVPVLGLGDVLLMIGHVPATRREPSIEVHASAQGAASLVDQMGFEPLLFEQLCLIAARPTAEVAAEVERLVAAGRCVRSGPWIERVV